MRPTQPTRRARLFALAAAAAALLAAAGCQKPWLAPRSAELVEVAAFPDQQVTGVAASRVTDRVFLTFPRWRDDVRTSVAELHPDGTLTPYPDGAWNSWAEGDATTVAERFVCAQAAWVDGAERLWVIDPGSPRLAGVIPGAAKLVRIDLATNTVGRVYSFDETVAPPSSYLNDVRVDLRSNHAFITDSGLGAIVVVNLETGEARRVLADHHSTKADPAVVPEVQGTPLIFASGPQAGNPAVIHADGVALDEVRGLLYWQALTSRRLFRAPVWALIDVPRTASLDRYVDDLGVTVVTDGMEMGPAHEVVFTALERDALIARTATGSLRVLARDRRLAWPDAVAMGPNGTLYVTVSQIHRTEWFSTGPQPPREPYRVFRLRWPR